jgi:AcrR family transcriptional regulator
MLHMSAVLQTDPDLQVTDPASPPAHRATEVRILEAALRLIGRRGVRRLGMQEISEAAGVSRGTLYRYFPSQEQVLAAAAAYDEQRFTLGLEQVLSTVQQQPTARIEAFVAYAFDYIRRHPARSLFDSEPDFVLSYLLDRLPRLRATLVARLGAELDSVPVVAKGDVSRDELADVIVRLFAASWIIPEPDDTTLVQTINHILLSDSA